MKALLLLLLPFLSIQNTHPLPTLKAEKTYYYFCVSHSKNPSEVTGTQVILFTEVSKITCEEKDLMKQAKKWSDLVGRNCQNEKGCTSDLNTYPTEDEAKLQLQITKEFYKDTQKYRLKKIAFE